MQVETGKARVVEVEAILREMYYAIAAANYKIKAVRADMAGFVQVKRAVESTRRELQASVPAVTQKVSYELEKSHDIVRKAWADSKVPLLSALSEMPGTTVAVA